MEDMEEYRCLKCNHMIVVNTNWCSPDYYDRIDVQCPACDTKHKRYFDEVITEDPDCCYDCPSIELAEQ